MSAFDKISIIITIMSLVLVIAFSAILREKKSSVICAVIIMSIANILANIIFGEGHTAFPGLIIFPLYGIIFALITIAVSNNIHRKRNPDTHKKDN